MSGNPNYVGKFLNGKKIVDVSGDAKFVNFYFEDGSYQTAPIIDSEVVVTFDEVADEEVVAEEEGDTTEDSTELGFYKTIQPIPYTNEEGEEIGKTKVGSIQEVPVVLGEFWVAQGWAEKTEKPEEESILDKVGGAINTILGNK